MVALKWVYAYPTHVTEVEVVLDVAVLLNFPSVKLVRFELMSSVSKVFVPTIVRTKQPNKHKNSFQRCFSC